MESGLSCWLEQERRAPVPAVLTLGLAVDPARGIDVLTVSLSLDKWRAGCVKPFERATILGLCDELLGFAESGVGEPSLIGYDDYDLRLDFRLLPGGEGKTVCIRGQILAYLGRDSEARKEELGKWLKVWGVGSGFQGLLTTTDDVARWAQEMADGVARLPEG
jgi:hypothetical protein